MHKRASNHRIGATEGLIRLRPNKRAPLHSSGLIFLLASALLLASLTFSRAARGAEANPGQPGPCPVASQAVTIGEFSTTIYSPNTNECEGWTAAPYPGVAFAHGFSMFGLSDGVAENAGNGEHLASWGYVVAIPSLPDDFETRTAGLQDVLDWLAAQAGAPGSFLYGKIDPGRLATAGYSTGGSTALAAAARDTRVQAVVALDPVNHEGTFGQEGAEIWDPQAEGPLIRVPAGVLGAPPSSCNAQSDYIDIFPRIGATHKAAYRLAGATHCDFPDPGSSFCGLTCGSASPDRRQLSQKYMTAWFNYYLLGKTGYYAYLYGDQAAQDAADNKVSAQVETAPHGLTGSASAGAVELRWQAYAHPEVAGYQLYRHLPGENFPATPYAQLGVVSAYTDTQVQPGQTYFYALRSCDPAGNLHATAEINFQVPGGGLEEPTTTPQPTESPTLPPTEPPAVQPPKVRIYVPFFLKDMDLNPSNCASGGR